MRTYTIHPLVVGLNQTDQGVMTYLRDYGQRILLPIYSFYLKGGDRTILVDTGLEQVVVADEVREACDFPIREFPDALATVDLTPEAVDVIIHTHLHNDHCENDSLCPNAAIYVQRTELEFMKDPHPLDHRYYPDVLDDLDVIAIEGDQEIFDGISVIHTPGHTVGGQSIVVNTAKGKVILTGFCCNEKNFPAVGPAVASGVHINAIDAYESAQRVKAAADLIVPLHAMWVGQTTQIP
ncbi:MAG: N-acyl homoserine lactonase family protein [Desulfobacterales bacterium]